MLIREAYEKTEDIILSEFATRSADSKGRLKKAEECDIRTCFQRDRDRIIHAKSFRRLKHKTQVLLSPEGDHYRTRLTHTLEVSQIARTIARALRLNEDLTEAIALGHDLGHTPFGHTGEMVLNEICTGGFRHYEQSLRVVDYLDGNGGLNLTFEVRDGILNHAGNNEASTLEGKIIKLADRIAYINHDIDDAIRGGIIKNDEIPQKCREILGNSHGKRIDTLIKDTINESMGKNYVKMSDDIYTSMMELREFMFERVYTGSIAKSEDEKAKNIVKVLFETYYNNIDIIPKNDSAMIEQIGKEQVVCDYIAGMTDNFAIKKFNDIFVPKAWSIW